MAEVLTIIVERACSYIPDVPVGEPVGESRIRKRPAPSKINKVPKEALTKFEQASNEAFSDVKVFPKEAFSEVKKVPAASVASDLVRNEIVLNYLV